jgi:hypothetical protein
LWALTPFCHSSFPIIPPRSRKFATCGYAPRHSAIPLPFVITEAKDPTPPHPHMPTMNKPTPKPDICMKKNPQDHLNFKQNIYL